MITIRCDQLSRYASVKLPVSKSISNRLLIIQALAKGAGTQAILSDADDTLLLQRCLNEFRNTQRLDVGNAGTAYRFLTSFLATQQGTWDLLCSERMTQRPISPLVDALRMLGAHIDYLQQQGFPPLRIQGRDLKGDRLFIDAGISSQFITALLLIAPALQQGLSLELTGEIASRPYIEMTVELMRMSGAIIKWNDRIIRVEPSEYSVGKYRGEADWSAAAFFYELAAISPINELGLLALKRPSIQGDARCAELWEQLGVRTRDTVAGVSLEKTNTFATEIEADFFDHPDLFIPFACSCAAKGVKLIATGLRNLSIKESDRLTALCTELNRSGYAAEVLNSNTFILYPEVRVVPSVAPVIKTYQDHRMAMAFAVLAATFGEISLDDLTCTSKSFPGFAVALDHLGLSTKVAI